MVSKIKCVSEKKEYIHRIKYGVEKNHIPRKLDKGPPPPLDNV